MAGVAILLFILSTAFFIWRRRRQRSQKLASELRVRPFLMRAPTPSPSQLSSLIHPPSSRVSTPDTRMDLSDFATRASSPPPPDDDDDEFSPSTTLFSRGNTQRSRRKVRPRSISTVPLVPPPFPSSPPAVASPPLKAPAWPEHQLPPPYRSL